MVLGTLCQKQDEDQIPISYKSQHHSVPGVSSPGPSSLAAAVGKVLTHLEKD